LLQPIGSLGFATLNTALYYREHTSLTVAFFFAFGLVVLPSGVEAFWPSGGILWWLAGLLLPVNLLPSVVCLPLGW